MYQFAYYTIKNFLNRKSLLLQQKLLVLASVPNWKLAGHRNVWMAESERNLGSFKKRGYIEQRPNCGWL